MSRINQWESTVPLSLNPCFTVVMLTMFFFYSAHLITFYLYYLNSQRPKIKFSHEVEINNLLPFLDINIYRSGSCFSTNVYYRTTFAGLLTSFHSFISFSYKKQLNFSLLNRCFNICSSYLKFLDELEKLKKIFMRNGYPDYLLDSCIASFLDKSPKITTVSKTHHAFLTTLLPHNISSKFALN